MSETSRLLAESVDRFLQRNAALDEEALFRALQESGFALAMAPEESGGLAAGFAEAATIARLWGYHAAPLPIVELLFSGRSSHEASPGHTSGTWTIASAVDRDGNFIAAQVPESGECLVPTDGGACVKVPVEAETVWRTVADEPMLSFAAVASLQSAEGGGTKSYAEVMRAGALLTVSRMVGAMERIVEIMIEHSKTRRQFGRPLAKFQLVQAMIADAASEVDATRAVLARALDLLDAGEADELVWRSARSQGSRAATLAAANAHQVLAAIGFTQEHVLHNLTRRLWAWRDIWTPQSEADAAVGRLACAAGGDRLWQVVADGPQDSLGGSGG